MKQLKKEYREKSGADLAQLCAQVALDNKAEELIVLDVRGLTTFTEYFVIMSGRSTRHVQSLAETIEENLRSKRVKSSSAEGLREGLWVLLDFDDVVIHIFYHEQRKFYNLEGLWSEAIQLEVAGA
ncbi:MAG: ribosome silencing factor [Deltaproteobacteria bacterium]|jgi:ribosome-associated protein|nr:MAG: ribosome silencing factor [Deltaproteobacteria bacterium]